MLLALLFYVCASMGTTGIMSFSVVALQAVHGTPIEYGTAALTGFLGAAALGHGGGAAGPGLVVDHDRLAKRLAQLFAVQARTDVAGGTRSVRTEHADRARGPLLGARAARMKQWRQGERSSKNASTQYSHDCLPQSPTDCATSCASCLRSLATVIRSERLATMLCIS